MILSTLRRIRKPLPNTAARLLALIPFVILVGFYLHTSAKRLAENPKDRLTPGISQIAEGWRSVWALREKGRVTVTALREDTLEGLANKISGDTRFATTIRPVEVPLDPPRDLRAGESLRIRFAAPEPDPDALPGFDDNAAETTSTETIHHVAMGETLPAIKARYEAEGHRVESIEARAEPFPRAIVTGEMLSVPLTERRVVTDIIASLKRLIVGVLIAISIALILGMSMGAFTPIDATFGTFMSGLAKIPPLALLPIIFIFQGIGEPAKITIIALGIAPTLTLDVYLRARDFPQELIVKAYTLGASTLEVLVKVMLPFCWPQILNAIRLSLGPAWVYLIASETFASESGLGSRIFIVQRQLGMNVILIYVFIIMLIGLAVDWAIREFIRRRYPWAEVQ